MEVNMTDPQLFRMFLQALQAMHPDWRADTISNQKRKELYIYVYSKSDCEAFITPAAEVLLRELGIPEIPITTTKIGFHTYHTFRFRLNNPRLKGWKCWEGSFTAPISHLIAKLEEENAKG